MGFKAGRSALESRKDLVNNCPETILEQLLPQACLCSRHPREMERVSAHRAEGRTAYICLQPPCDQGHKSWAPAHCAHSILRAAPHHNCVTSRTKVNLKLSMKTFLCDPESPVCDVSVMPVRRLVGSQTGQILDQRKIKTLDK